MIIKIIDKIVNTIVFVIILFFIFLGSYSLYASYKIYNESTQKIEYEEVINDNEQIINKDIIGHIKIYNTIIDYPVLQGKDNKKYLTTNYKNEYSISGSIFLDYRNDPNLNDDFSIIYGHNMSYKAMFSELKEYKNTSYFNNHNKGILDVGDKSYEITILLYKEVNTYDDIPYNLYLYKNNHNDLIYKTLSSKDGNYDKLLVLSTCSSSNKNKRVILIALLTSFT